MFDLILNFAKKNDLIKAVLLNGSRANPNAKKDKFMDYDIVYVVENTEPFIKNKSFISYFGEILIMQEPDNQDLFTPEIPNEQKYTYLMQFKDGNRIDLTFATLEFAKIICSEDSCTVILLDKNNILPKLPAASDKSYHIKKPSENEFLACCNEFWWLCTYVLKGLQRNQIVYASEVFNQNIYPEFMKMTRWFIGLGSDFKVTSGKYDKYFEKLLMPEIYEKLLKTYPGANTKDIWKSLKMMCDLFCEFSNKLSFELDFKYDIHQSEYVADYIFGSEKMLKKIISSAVLVIAGIVTFLGCGVQPCYYTEIDLSDFLVILRVALFFTKITADIYTEKIWSTTGYLLALHLK